MTRKQLIERAEFMDFDVAEAMRHRVKYLAEQRDAILQDIEECEDDILFNESLNHITKVYLAISVESLKTHLKKVNREIKALTTLPREGEITDDMVEQARAYPIENLIDFTRNRSKAFCHDSDSDSLMKANHGNYAWCHVCGILHNPIDVLMRRDGYSFVDAVRQLT
jgi:RNA polymerase-binding transcription factor DksA